MRFHSKRFYLTVIGANGCDYYGPFNTGPDAYQYAKQRFPSAVCYVDQGKPALAL